MNNIAERTIGDRMKEHEFWQQVIASAQAGNHNVHTYLDAP